MVGFKGNLIHVFNKNEDAIHSSNYFEKLRLRTNVILMGDSIGDVKMAFGVPQPNSVLKIGFLNGKVSTTQQQPQTVVVQALRGHCDTSPAFWFVFHHIKINSESTHYSVCIDFIFQISERLESFMDKFDIVLLDDQTMNLAKSIVDLMES